MTNHPETPATTEPDDALDGTVIRKPSRISWIWLVPIVAAIAGATLVVRAWMERGPEITITFQTAEGLDVGKTQVRYKDVTVGTVKRIELSEDWTYVEVTAEIYRHAEQLASQGSRFWVVRPRLGLSGVSGLGTLISGAYIEVDVPPEVIRGERPSQTHFTGLETPPEILHDRAGSRFHLDAATLGSLDIGSPVYFRQIKVGQVVGYRLDHEGDDVDVQVFIDAPYDRYVTGRTRFWNASGIDLHVGTDGLQLRTESLLAIALGGVAFESLGEGSAEQAAANTAFKLYASETAARAEPDGLVMPVQMRFDQSIRGLEVGAEVNFKGIALGEVTQVGLEYDSDSENFYALVQADLYPERLGPAYEQVEAYTRKDLHTDNFLEPMIARGLRAQLQTASFLTGQLYVVIDTVPDTPKVEPKVTTPFEIPTIPGELNQLERRVSQILTRIENLPLEQIGDNTNKLLADAARMIRRLDQQVTPEAQQVLRQAGQTLNELNALLASDAPIVINSERALQELTRAARSLRTLADFLQANPDALIRGR